MVRHTTVIFLSYSRALYLLYLFLSFSCNVYICIVQQLLAIFDQLNLVCMWMCMCVFFSLLLAIGQLTIKLKNNDTLQQQQEKNVYLKKQKEKNKNTIPKGVEPHTTFLCIQILRCKICKRNINSRRSSNVSFHNVNVVYAMA